MQGTPSGVKCGQAQRECSTSTRLPIIGKSGYRRLNKESEDKNNQRPNHEELYRTKELELSSEGRENCPPQVPVSVYSWR